MKIADLYIRVSTDEQADRGYSQRSQEELLRKYCDINGISIRKVIFEDHSAKTFNRPEWKSYLLDLRKHKYQADFVLFLKWDRFSRNAGDVYQMINMLRKLGVEPQAVEQPLDLAIPENKMMLAFYLAAPEMTDLFKIVLTEAWYDQTNHLQDDRKQLLLQIKELEEKISYIRDLLSSKQIDPSDFREMKTEYSAKLEKVEAKLGAYNYNHVDIKDLLDKGISNLLRLENLYETADIEKKREIISSMYPEKMTFNGFSFRTSRINEVARMIYSLDEDYSENENRTNGNNSSLSCQVGAARLPPALRAYGDLVKGRPNKNKVSSAVPAAVAFIFFRFCKQACSASKYKSPWLRQRLYF